VTKLLTINGDRRIVQELNSSTAFKIWSSYHMFIDATKIPIKLSTEITKNLIPTQFQQSDLKYDK